MGPKDVVDWVGVLTGERAAVTILILIIVGGFRQWWVYGWYYKQERTERVALAATQERTILVAEKMMRSLDQEEA